MTAAMRVEEPETVARSAVPLLLVCAAVVLVETVVLPASAGVAALVASWAVVGLLVGAAAACRWLPADRLNRVGVFSGLALVGVALVTGLNLLTRDTSAGAQAAYAFPVMWAASHLRRKAVAMVTAAAVAGDASVLCCLSAPGRVLTDLLFLGAVLITMAVMLVRAGAVQARLVAALREQARVDALTGLVNRRVFDEALHAAVSGPAPAGTALVLVDVDEFKAINDGYGHPVGDSALAHLALVLASQVRAVDALPARLGGDELALLLPGCSAEAAARRAEQLLEAVRAAPLVLPDGGLLALSISVGVAHAPTHAASIDRLYAAADTALYEAKRNGRGRVAVGAV